MNGHDVLTNSRLKAQKRVDYWKYRLEHERAAHRTTKRQTGETIRDLVRRLDKNQKMIFAASKVRPRAACLLNLERK